MTQQMESAIRITVMQCTICNCFGFEVTFSSEHASVKQRPEFTFTCPGLSFPLFKCSNAAI